MINIVEFSKSIDETLNKLGTNKNFNVSIPAKVRAINLAQLKLIKNKLGILNPSKKGFESFRRRFDELDFLIVPNKEVSVQTIDDSLYADTSLLEDYMYYIKSYCTATKGKCKNRKLTNHLVNHNDLINYLKDKNYKPSFEWEEQYVTLSNGKLEIHKADDYTVNKLYLYYIRQPKPVNLSGYTQNGVASQNINSEFPESLRDELLDMTCQLIASNNVDMAQYQFTEARISKSE